MASPAQPSAILVYDFTNSARSYSLNKIKTDDVIRGFQTEYRKIFMENSVDGQIPDENRLKSEETLMRYVSRVFDHKSDVSRSILEGLYEFTFGSISHGKIDKAFYCFLKGLILLKTSQKLTVNNLVNIGINPTLFLKQEPSEHFSTEQKISESERRLINLYRSLPKNKPSDLLDIAYLCDIGKNKSDNKVLQLVNEQLPDKTEVTEQEFTKILMMYTVWARESKKSEKLLVDIVTLKQANAEKNLEAQEILKKADLIEQEMQKMQTEHDLAVAEKNKELNEIRSQKLALVDKKKKAQLKLEELKKEAFKLGLIQN